MALSVGPIPRAAATFQKGQNSLLPRVEALSMHELSDGTVLVVTDDLDRVVQGVQSYQGVTAETFTRRRTATSRTLIVTDVVTVVGVVMTHYQIVLHVIGVLTSGCTAVIVPEATASGVTVAVAPRGHGSRKSDLETRRTRFIRFSSSVLLL